MKEEDQIMMMRSIREKMEGRLKDVVGEVMACLAMVMIEACTIFLTIMASTAMARGMSPFVFVVYTNALGTFILFIYAFFIEQDDSEESIFMNFSLLVRIFFLGLIGITVAQNLAFVGLSYSSPIVACGMANIVPAISFILALVLRSIKFEWKSSGSQARIIGTWISIMGAISLTVYKGPAIMNQSPASSSSSFLLQRLLVFSSTHENWALGCTLFAAASLSLSIWNIIQAGTVKKYPQIMKIVSLYSFFGTIQTTVLAAIVEKDPGAWRLKLDMELLIIVLTALFGSLIRSKVQLWCIRTKGPSFVLIFKPVGIPVASTCGCLFFATTFHYGSMMAAVVCGIGYYTVLWGQFKDDEAHKAGNTNLSQPSDEKVPLLHEADSQV